jgi:hypothetical protein
VGYAARGLVYCIVGLTALAVAIGTRQRPVSLTDSLNDLSREAFGTLVSGSIGLGMSCFALWRISQGVLDADNLGSDYNALLRRTAYSLSALLYFGVAVIAAETTLRFHMKASPSTSPQSWAAWLLGLPLGSLVLAVIGIGFCAVAMSTVIRGYRAIFKNDLDLQASAKRYLVPIGRAGYVARATIYAIVGYFLVRSAFTVNVHEVRDMAGALNVIQQQPFARWDSALSIRVGATEIIEGTP